jgi:hypothetical protein
MAYVVELAEHTGLPVETVLRVLLRKPTNEEARQKVADAVGALGPPEYPLPDGHIEVLPAAETAPALLEPSPDAQELALELRGLFQELVTRLDRERRERVDDLELTTDLISETWQNVDRRLGRLEKMIARIERRGLEQPPVGNGREIRRLEDVWRPGT